MPICQNAEGVHDQVKVGNPWFRGSAAFMNYI